LHEKWDAPCAQRAVPGRFDRVRRGSGSAAVTLPNNVKELDFAKDARPNKVGVALAALVMQIGGNSRGVSPSIPALFPIIASLKKDTFWLIAQIPQAMVELE